MIEYDADPYVCSAAARIGAELHRLAPAVHAAARPHGGPVLAPLRRYGGFLVDLRTLLLHGGAPLPAVRAIHRYQPGVDEAVDALAGGGWLVVHGGAVLATDRCRAVLSSLMAVLDRTSEALWGRHRSCWPPRTRWSRRPEAPRRAPPLTPSRPPDTPPVTPAALAWRHRRRAAVHRALRPALPPGRRARRGLGR